MSGVCNPFAQLVDAATRPAAVPATPQPTQARDGELRYEMLIRLIRENQGISTGALAKAAGLDHRRVWGLLKTPIRRGAVQHVDDGWRALPAAMTHAFEQLHWHPAAEKPDSDITVVAWNENDGYFCAWWDDGLGQWIDCAHGGVVQEITHWAKPKGPR